MRVRHRRNGAERTVELDSLLDGFTVADLAAALGELAAADGCGTPRGLSIDGCWHPPDTPLSSVRIWEGALLETAPNEQAPSRFLKQGPGAPGRVSGPVPGGAEEPAGSAAEGSTPGPARRLVVVGGLRSGSSLPAPPASSWVIGRAHTCDVVLDDAAVSRRHARVLVGEQDGRVLITDLGSRNGTVVAGRAVAGTTPVPTAASVRLGATRIQWRASVDDTPAAVRAGIGATAGRIPFNRPPRRRPRMTPSPLRVPAEPPPQPEPEPLGWAGIVLPVIAGLVMALVWSPFMAVFAALGPVITVGTWLERRRRSNRKHRQACRRVQEAVEQLVAALPSVRAAARRRALASVPDLAEVVRRAQTPSVRCWERRLADPDAMKLGVGTADVPFAPPVEVVGKGPAASEALEALAASGPLEDVPVAVSLMPGEVVGIVGTPPVARSVARGLVLQAAVLHGPADLALVCLAPGCGADWGWTRWLPHTTDTVGGATGALVATDTETLSLAAEAAAADKSARVKLALIDGTAVLTGRGAPGRILLGLQRATGIVLVEDTCDLPAACTTIIEVRHDAGGLRLLDPRSANVLEPVVAWGVTVGTATAAAARLARLDDPDLDASNTNLPEMVSLIDLLGEPTPDAVSRRWAATRGTADLRALIGAGRDGPLELDLVADGPHLLVGGTTGSGKSELLRSLVASLATFADPDHLAFVLVDYKGGAAFDRCADMPHVAGMVTDLDDRLAERALVCLEAELRHREERLRSVGAEDLAAFRARCRHLPAGSDASEPLPRLVVVVDEFATLAAELPEFLDSLVGIAQRGRSLGVHMVLATQRPAGVVTEDIRANTSCRIALRVTDRHDSNDVIGAPDAARIPRRIPGRALARLGPGELVAFQSALVTGTTRQDSAGLRATLLGEWSRGTAAPFPDAPEPSAPESPAGSEDLGDLDRLVDAVRAAHHRCGGCPPRSPWPAPLPAKIDSAALAATAGPDEPAAWLVDDPEHQRQFTGGWQPRDGHLVVVGGPASGKSTTLVAAIFDLCRRRSPADLHVYVIDLDAGLLSVLDGLPHVGAVILPADGDRRTRVLRFLDDQVASRRSGAGRGRQADMVLIVDDFAGLARAHDPVRDPKPHERLARIWSDGPAVGVRVAVSLGRAADLPPDLAAAAGVVLVHATSDSSDGLRFGLRASAAGLNPGRALRAGDGREVQVGLVGEDDLEAAAVAFAEETVMSDGGPASIGALPAVVEANCLPVGATVGGVRIDLHFAMGDLTLQPAGFVLHDGEHALVLGPPRTGRTATLAAMAEAARMAGVEVMVVADRPSDLSARLGVAPVAADRLTAGAVDDEQTPRRLLLVDDADHVADPAGTLARIAALQGGRSHLVAATTADRMRSSFGHWLAELRSCRTGVLFRPGPLDGDLLGAALPARLTLASLPGRGLIVADGAAVVAQMALVDAGRAEPPQSSQPAVLAQHG